MLQLAVSYHHHWHRHRQGEEDPGSQRCNFQPSAHTVTNLQKVHTDYFYCCKHLISYSVTTACVHGGSGQRAADCVVKIVKLERQQFHICNAQ